mgnify:CR=1 FL=1
MVLNARIATKRCKPVKTKPVHVRYKTRSRTLTQSTSSNKSDNTVVNTKISSNKSPTSAVDLSAVLVANESIVYEVGVCSGSDISYMQNPCVDIDATDSKNPLSCSIYMNDMYAMYHQMEKEFQLSHNYLLT